jgi:hypothetical protein
MADIQREIWKGSVAALGGTTSGAPAILLVPALNAMFDVTTTRTVALQTHQPLVIFLMLAMAMLSCSLLAGFDMGEQSGRSWLHVICFAAVLTVSFYVILDLEYPRLGLIRINWMDQLFHDLRAAMG